MLADDVVGLHPGRRTYAALQTSKRCGFRFGDLEPRPLAVAMVKEGLMHDPRDPKIERSLPYKSPGDRVHDSRGRVHDESANSPGPMRDGSAEPTTCQIRGFMVPGKGVHDCRIAPPSLGPPHVELNAAFSSVRPPAPSMRRTFGEPTAAERRPGRRTLFGIALRSPLLAWLGRYSVTSLSQRTFGITSARFTRLFRPSGICPMHPDPTGKNDGELIGLTVSPASTTIMKVAARHEVESKIDVQYYWTCRRCRWPTRWACPRGLLEVAALGEEA